MLVVLWRRVLRLRMSSMRVNGARRACHSQQRWAKDTRSPGDQSRCGGTLRNSIQAFTGFATSACIPSAQMSPAEGDQSSPFSAKCPQVRISVSHAFIHLAVACTAQHQGHGPSLCVWCAIGIAKSVVKNSHASVRPARRKKTRMNTNDMNQAIPTRYAVYVKLPH